MSNYYEKEFENLIQSAIKGITNFIRVIFFGIKRLPSKKTNFIFLVMWVLIGWALIRFRVNIWSLMPNEKDKLEGAALIISKLKYLVYIGFALPFLYLYYKGEEYKKDKTQLADMFEEIGFFSGLKKKVDGFTGEKYDIKNTPQLLKKWQDGKKTMLTFKSNIPIQEWKRRGPDLETIMNCHIVKVEPARKSRQEVTLHTIAAEHGLGDFIPWDNKFIRMDLPEEQGKKKGKETKSYDGKFEIVAGVSMLEEVAFDLVKSPHILIAGLTGSGKSVLETCMSWQAIRKGAKPFMVDFKGGIEFGPFEQFGEVITERKRAIEVLRQLTEENTLRMALFKREGVRDLEEYNQKHPKNKLCRIVLLCDEIGEMLDKDGADKEEKREVEEISKQMSKLARLSRAPGINMILATQRPDAKILTGQIKANLVVRISGRMVDSYNSEMVLGNTKATEIADIKGRFMYAIGNETWEFQAYAFKTSYMKKGKYENGKMLIDGNNITEEEIESVLEEVEEIEKDDETRVKENRLRNIFKIKKDPLQDTKDQEDKQQRRSLKEVIQEKAKEKLKVKAVASDKEEDEKKVKKQPEEKPKPVELKKVADEPKPDNKQDKVVETADKQGSGVVFDEQDFF